MLMAAAAAAAVHMDSTHSSSAGSTISPPPPWHPAVPVPVATLRTHQQHHQTVLFDRDHLTTPSPSPSPPPRNHHHQQLRPAPGAARRPSRPSRRRPRPSRKVPTTYITADPASFRRLVHQVTGAHDLPLPPLAPPPHEATTLCRPAPSRAAAAGALKTLLPTLDTSALLLGIGAGSESARRTTGPLTSVRPAAAVSEVVDVGAGGDVGVGLGGAGYGGSDCGAGGGALPTLESWDALLY